MLAAFVSLIISLTQHMANVKKKIIYRFVYSLSLYDITPVFDRVLHKVCRHQRKAKYRLPLAAMLFHMLPKMPFSVVAGLSPHQTS